MRALFSSVSLLLLMSGSVVHAAKPVTTLLRFVPEDSRFCVVVQNLRAHYQQLMKSPFMKKVEGSALKELLDELKRQVPLDELDQMLEQQFGLKLSQLRDDILGDAVVIAYRHPTKDRKEQGLILLHARDAELLRKTYLRFAKQASEQLSHGGNSYVRLGEGKDETYLHQSGSILLYCNNEEMLQEALDHSQKKVFPLVKRFEPALQKKPLVCAWINPRSFDGDLRAVMKQAPGPIATVLKNFAPAWKQLHDVFCTLSLDENLELGLALKLNEKQLPKTVQTFLEKLTQPSDLWSRIPSNAIAAGAVKIDLVSLFGFLTQAQSPESKKGLEDLLNYGTGLFGKDLRTEVLPNLGPDCGFYITSPPRSSEGWIPSIVVAMRVSPGNKSAPIDQTLMTGLRIAATAGAVAYNSKNPLDPVRWKILKTEQGEAQYASCKKGRELGLVPTFGLTQGYLVLASSPEAWKEFALRKPTAVKSKETPLFRLSIAELRRYIRKHQIAVTKFLAAQNETTARSIQEKLNGFMAILSLVESLDLRQTRENGLIHFQLRAQFAASLR